MFPDRTKETFQVDFRVEFRETIFKNSSGKIFKGNKGSSLIKNKKKGNNVLILLSLEPSTSGGNGELAMFS